LPSVGCLFRRGDTPLNVAIEKFVSKPDNETASAYAYDIAVVLKSVGRLVPTAENIFVSRRPPPSR
jgi:hypothetical protein